MEGVNEISDLFVATTMKLKKISIMAYTKEFEELTYEKIVRVTKKNTRQNKDKESIFCNN